MVDSSLPPGGAVPEPPPTTQSQETDLQFLTRAVPPPTLLYVGKDTILNVQVNTAIAGQVLGVRYRLMLLDGTITEGFEFIRPNALPTTNSNNFPLSEGFLLSLMIMNIGGVPSGSVAYVFAGLTRDPSLTIPIGEVILQGYVTTFAALTWPFGQIRQNDDSPGQERAIVGTAPAAGAEIVQTVPAGLMWHLAALSFTLVTSAAAANRNVSITLDDGANIFYQAGGNVNQIATTTRRYSGGEGIPFGDTLTDILIPLPAGRPRLKSGFRIHTVTANIQGADQFAAPVMWVDEWVQV